MNQPKDVLIFFSFKKHKTGYYNLLFNPLKEQEDRYGLKLHQGSLKDLHIEVKNNQLSLTESMTGKALHEFAYIYLELWLKSPQQALAAATYLHRYKIPFIGHEALTIPCSTKIGELVRLSDNGVPLPNSFMSSHPEILKRFKTKPPFAYPFIAKAADTFGGKMNFLVKNYEELEQALKAHPNQFFVLQEFIPNDCDYRVLIMGGEIKLVLRRSRKPGDDSHLNNTSAGGEGEFVPIDTLSLEMQHDALQAAKLTLRSDFAGADVIVDKTNGKHYILEVNEAPAIQMGENPPVKIAALMTHIQQQAGVTNDKKA